MHGLTARKLACILRLGELLGYSIIFLTETHSVPERGVHKLPAHNSQQWLSVASGRPLALLTGGGDKPLLGSGGAAILVSKATALDAQAVPLRDAEGEEHSDIVACTITTRGGNTIGLVATYFIPESCWGGAGRNKEMHARRLHAAKASWDAMTQLVLRWNKEGTLVIVGTDLNGRLGHGESPLPGAPRSALLRDGPAVTTARGRDLYALAVALGGNVHPGRFSNHGPTHPATGGNVDNLVVCRGLAPHVVDDSVMNNARHTQLLTTAAGKPCSDHLPVGLVIRLPLGPADKRSPLRTKEELERLKALPVYGGLEAPPSTADSQLERIKHALATGLHLPSVTLLTRNPPAPEDSDTRNLSALLLCQNNYLARREGVRIGDAPADSAPLPPFPVLRAKAWDSYIASTTSLRLPPASSVVEKALHLQASLLLCGHVGGLGAGIKDVLSRSPLHPDTEHIISCKRPTCGAAQERTARARTALEELHRHYLLVTAKGAPRDDAAFATAREGALHAVEVAAEVEEQLRHACVTSRYELHRPNLLKGKTTSATGQIISLLLKPAPSAPLPASILDCQGRLTVTAEQRRNAVEAHISKLYNPPLPPPLSSFLEALEAYVVEDSTRVMAHMDSHAGQPTPPPPTPPGPGPSGWTIAPTTLTPERQHWQLQLCHDALTATELKHALRKLRSAAAHGADAISPDMLKHADPALHAQLLLLYNTCFAQHSLPHFWKIAVGVLIHKGKGLDPRDVGNFRLIMMQSVVPKTLFHIYATRITTIAEALHILPDSQFGWRKNLGTMHATFILLETVRLQLAQGQCVYLALCDATKAFDMPQRAKLLFAMAGMGYRGRLLLALRDCLTGRRLRMGAAHEQWHLSPICRGTGQGCPLSSILYILLLAYVLASVTETPPIYPMQGSSTTAPSPPSSAPPGIYLHRGAATLLLFICAVMVADDVNLMANSEGELQRLLNRVVQLQGMMDITVNNKTTIMLMRPDGHPLPRVTPRISLGGALLKVVNSATIAQHTQESAQAAHEGEEEGDEEGEEAEGAEEDQQERAHVPAAQATPPDAGVAGQMLGITLEDQGNPMAKKHAAKLLATGTSAVSLVRRVGAGGDHLPPTHSAKIISMYLYSSSNYGAIFLMPEHRHLLDIAWVQGQAAAMGISVASSGGGGRHALPQHYAIYMLQGTPLVNSISSTVKHAAVLFWAGLAVDQAAHPKRARGTGKERELFQLSWDRFG